MRQLSVAMLCQWYAMFAYWQYITFAVGRSLYDTSDPSSAAFREATLTTQQAGASYNFIAFLGALALIPIVRRLGARLVTAICLTASGVAMLMIPGVETTAALFILMLRRVIPDKDEDCLDRFIGSGLVDGVIVIGQSDQFDRIEDVADGYLPMVVWGNHQEGQRHCVVGTDNVLGGKLAAERLIAAGCTSLAFMGETQAIEFAARHTGAKAVADERGVPIRQWATHLSSEKAAGDIARHLERHAGEIDGIFATTDMIAIAGLKQLKERGVDVPGSIKLIGFDDLADIPRAHHHPAGHCRRCARAGRPAAETHGRRRYRQPGPASAADYPANRLTTKAGAPAPTLRRRTGALSRGRGSARRARHLRDTIVRGARARTAGYPAPCRR